MNEQFFREKLYDKVQKEYEKFKVEELKKSKKQIFENAYQISKLHDFTYMCYPEDSCLHINTVKALLKEEQPLFTLYDYYMDTCTEEVTDLFEIISDKLSDLVEQNKIKDTIKKDKKEKDFER